MHIRPVDLPELRAAVANQFHSEATMRRMFTTEHMPNAIELAEIGSEFAEAMSEAVMFHVSAPMTALALNAAEHLELFSLTPEDLPTENGFIVFDDDGRHLHLTFTDGCMVGVHGFFWLAIDNSVHMAPLIVPHGSIGQGDALAIDPQVWMKVAYNDAVGEFEAKEDNGNSQMLALLLTAWLLLSQPLAQTHQVEPDRAVRKRLRRIGQEPGPVRVIELRRPERAEGTGDGSREYHHSWIVRGHWRQHWYPARQVHRPLWIAPHIKGPEDAPLIGGEKVYALKR